MTLEHALTTLETSGLIRLAQMEPELEYLFRHALVQEATYHSILRGDRRTLHRTVAEVLERLFPDQIDTLAFLLAQHWREVGEIERARNYFIRAGDVARRSYANQEAIAAYTEALALTNDPAQRFDLLTARVEAYDIAALRDEQKADVGILLQLGERLDDDIKRCDASIAQADYYLKTEHVSARIPAKNALKIARIQKDRLREGRALYRLILVDILTGANLKEGHLVLENAATLLQEMGYLSEAAACWHELAILFNEIYDNKAALHAAEEAIRISRQAGDLRQEAIGLRRLVSVYLNQGNPERALPLAQLALRQCQVLGDRLEECRSLNSLGINYLILGAKNDAVNCLYQSLEVAQDIQYSHGIWSAVSSLRHHFQNTGKYEEGIKFLETQLAKAYRSDDKLLKGELHRQSARILLVIGQYEKALTHLQTWLPIAEQAVGLSAQASALALSGYIEAELGRWPDAYEHLTRGLELAHQTGIRTDLAIPLLENAEASLLTGQPDQMYQGLSYAEQVVEIFRGSKDVRATFIISLNCAARLHYALEDWISALSYSSEAIRLLGDTPNQLFFFTHSRALRANGRETEADEYLQKAYDRVMLVASKTKDETLRKSWLENVRDNREIIAEWNARNLTPET